MKTRQLKPVITKYLVWGEGFGGILPTQIGEEQNIPFMVLVFYLIKYR